MHLAKPIIELHGLDNIPTLVAPSSSQFLAQGVSMDSRTVRCPYCVADNDFRRMVMVGDNRHICQRCWHVTAPKNKDFQCQCGQCIRLRAHVEPVCPPSRWPMEGREKAMHPDKQPVAGKFPWEVARISKLV